MKGDRTKVADIRYIAALTNFIKSMPVFSYTNILFEHFIFILNDTCLSFFNDKPVLISQCLVTCELENKETNMSGPNNKN